MSHVATLFILVHSIWEANNTGQKQSLSPVAPFMSITTPSSFSPPPTKLFNSISKTQLNYLLSSSPFTSYNFFLPFFFFNFPFKLLKNFSLSHSTKIVDLVDFNGRRFGERLQWPQALFEEEKLPEARCVCGPQDGNSPTWGCRRREAPPPDLADQDLP